MEQAAAAATKTPAKRSGGLNVLLVALLLFQLLVACAFVAWPFLRASGTPAAARGPAPSIAVTPDPAPPLTPATLAAIAAPAATSAGESPAGRLSSLAESLQARLAALPLEGGAPAHLIVLGSGQQTVEKIAEIPRHERWELQFPPGNTVESYARQLEYFHIELGLIGGSDKITYVTNLADPAPKTRTGPAAAEDRLYLVWQRGSMQAADEQLVSKAKEPLADRIVAHFCPPDLQTQLVQLEDAAAKAAGRTRVRKTIFAIRPNEFGGFRLHVLEQRGE